MKNSIFLKDSFRNMCLLIGHFALVACGPVGSRDINKAPTSTLSYAKNQVLCDQVTRGEKTPADDLIQMEDEANQLARDYFTRRGYFYSLPAAQSYQHMLMTPEKPLVLNDEFFKSEFAFVSEHMSSWIPEIRSELHSNNGPASPLSFDRAEFDRIKSRLSAASQLAVRYKNYSCQLNHLAQRKKNDVRPYYRLKDLECQDNQNEHCLETRLKRWNEKDDTLYKDLVSMCSKVHSEALCMSMISFSNAKRSLLSFYQNLKKEFHRKVIDPLFLLESRSPHLSCHTNEEGKKVLTLDLVVRPNDVVRFAGGLYTALAYVENAWSTEKVRFKVNHLNVGEGKPIVNFKKGITSHVDSDTKSVISLNSRLQGLGLTKTLAHEIGHVIGFKDCYIEFFDQEKRSLVYYEIDRDKGNIMCSIDRGYRAPDEYIDQLAQHYCQ
ncbi:MAG: hypothetical protein EP326_02960 [Deltaproteobacteria bacterium]|nr:MAG: hypothetical protein EP326_02960 [Deltaproteobacteria bacterium]